MNINESPYREPGTWSTTPRFRSWYLFQKYSKDLVIYCEYTKCPVRIAWPTNSLGVRVSPGWLLIWLRERCLVWYCFCQDDVVNSGEERSCRIGLDADGKNIGAFCHFPVSRCGFNINLTDLFRDALHESKYRHLDVDVEDPTLEYDAFFQAFEDDQEESDVAFMLRSESGDSSSSDEEESDCDDDDHDDDNGARLPTRADLPTGAYLEGYCGALFPDIPQLEANFSTHIFQRRLESECRAIREEKRQKIETLNLGTRWGVRPEELSAMGITFEEFYDESLN
ncbi:hypothetical protein BKA70DRAFT_1437045 [Coprinopsis sp. MPI-PUGE-AT-0042]|nr:hypothetical protein BKA70DRAFT_1437045 [Coprinopsis sp. MPI-PUGE-AT-0042]